MDILTAVIALLPSVISLATEALKHFERGESSAAKISVEEMSRTLATFQGYLRTAVGEGSDGFAAEIQNLVLEIEDALDEFMYDIPHCQYRNKLHKSLHDMGHKMSTSGAEKRLSLRWKDIEVKRKRVTELYTALNGGRQAALPRGQNLATRCLPANNQIFGDKDKIVGLKKRRTDLVKQMIEGSTERMTILLLGPGGSGKTFLVNSVFQSPEVKREFDVKAWVVVPRRCEVEELLLELLSNSCTRNTVEEVLGQAGSTGEKLYRYLEDKRYLVVLDDVRDKQDYESIRNFLPCGLRGSRIIVTTRNNSVVDTPWE